jgi:hypothetical protein
MVEKDPLSIFVKTAFMNKQKSWNISPKYLLEDTPTSDNNFIDHWLYDTSSKRALVQNIFLKNYHSKSGSR